MLGLGLGLHKNRFRGGGSTPLLLDTYTNAAIAYSLRKLRTEYVGSAIRVRRASDNSEMNIGFVNNELDTATLETFCSGTNGFVTTWYDQSTNGNNVTQAISLNQPQIVSSGVILLENGKPAVNFNGITNYLSSATGFGTTEYTGFHAFTMKSNILNQRVIHIKNGGNNIHMIRLDASNMVYPRSLTDLIDYNSPLTTFVNNVMNLSSFYNKDTMYLNNSLVLNKSTANTGVQGSNGIYLGCRADLTNFANLRISETISFAIDRSADITSIDANINSYYNIY